MGKTWFRFPALIWILTFSCAGLGRASEAFDPPALYLTWQSDPTTTMTVHWQTEDEARPRLFYREQGTSKDWSTGEGVSLPLPSSDRTIHRVEIKELKPEASYDFCFWPGEKRFHFRTAPKDLSKPVRFVVGGDVYHERDFMDTMNELAGKLDPLFVAWGGDLAYSCERAMKPEKMERWVAFWDSWKSKGRAHDGRLIPLLVTIGNHEVHGSWRQPTTNAPAYYAQFPTPGDRGYESVDFGNYLSVLLLDSGITHPMDGEQLSWLEKTLHQRRKVPHLVPIYHIPAYPSVRPELEGENGELTAQVRNLWCPLFEKNGVKIAFENHDHSYKRTHPIKAGRIDPSGIIYLGDGAWGVRLRKPQAERWYLDKADAIRHLFLVTVSNEGRQVLAVNDKGEFFDEVYQSSGKGRK
jgi:hypothetical protein